MSLSPRRAVAAAIAACVHARGFGRADQTGRPVTPDTPFLIASISKPVCGVAIMQLAEQGRLDLDAPVARYIPWFQVKAPDGGASITVRHLLWQTSGIPREAGYEPLTDRRITSMEAAVRALAHYELAQPPGQRFEYSNANFAVLGLLVEVLTGQSYEQYVRANITEPLGMHHTYFTEADARAGGMAQGHTTWFGLPVRMDPPFLEHATPYYNHPPWGRRLPYPQRVDYQAR